MIIEPKNKLKEKQEFEKNIFQKGGK